MQAAHKGHQGAGAFREFEAVEKFLPLVEGFRGAGRQSAAHHVAEVQLGEFVAGEIQAGEPLALQFRH